MLDSMIQLELTLAKRGLPSKSHYSLITVFILNELRKISFTPAVFPL